MALLSTLFTALSRKLGDLLQALFGWSVAALFGRLTSKTQAFVTVALVLSLCWPIFVVGVFFPATATFLISFIPIENETVRAVLRVVWIVLAVIAPLLVAMLVRAAAPVQSRRPVLMTMLNGYPLTLGMALSFLVTAVTVPITRLASMARRWEEQHLFVQPRENRYDDVLGHLVVACEAADLEPRVEPVPKQMSLSVKVLRFFSRGAIEAFIARDPRRVACDGLELYLYPADLLIRGEPKKVAHVRARLSATMLERDAWLVKDPEAQELQGDLCRLREVVDAHEDIDDVKASVERRIDGIEKAAWAAKKLPFDDWLAIERIARRLEADVHGLKSQFDLKTAEAASPTPPPSTGVVEDAPLPTLLQEILKETRALASTEAELARQEAAALAKKAIGVSAAVAAAIALGGAAIALGCVAIVMNTEAHVTAAAVAAGCLAGAALVVAIAAYVGVPKQPMEQTRHRLERDWRLISERAS